MLQKIRTDQLRVGMYILLPRSWTRHPFLRNRFAIKSQDQIRKIVESGITAVMVDPVRSTVPVPAEAMEAEPTMEELGHMSHDGKVVDPKTQTPPDGWDPEQLKVEALTAAIEDKKLTPEEKADAVYHHSMQMMEQLVAHPSRENILTSKRAVSAITDLILSDDQTSTNLLRITSHDFYTYTHSVNVGVTAIMLAKALFRRSDAHDLHELGAGFFLHDLGKVKVDSAIINKPGRLTDREMQRMRTHPYQGYKMLEEAGALSEECRYIVMQHHEFADGGGYPKRLKGDEIHIYGKICGIADVFDALTAERSYKKAMTPFDALKLMQQQMSHHFDRELFSRFVLLFQ
jgi:HD-GYP domain-containing protein (c-di-GMP phosphodiesterase class II)